MQAGSVKKLSHSVRWVSSNPTMLLVDHCISVLSFERITFTGQSLLKGGGVRQNQ